VVCCCGRVAKDWQSGVIFPIHKKEDRRASTNYRGISLLLLGKVNAKCLKGRRRKIVKSKLDDTQCGVHPGRSTTDQIYILQQIFDVYSCFVDLEKAYDGVPREKRWGVLLESC